MRLESVGMPGASNRSLADSQNTSQGTGGPMGRLRRFFLRCFPNDLFRIDGASSPRSGRILLNSGDAVLQKSRSPSCYRMAAELKSGRDFLVLLSFCGLQ